jgi:hypothetical protein
MWYSEDDKRWYCTNEKCVRYKPQPVEQEQESDNGNDEN